VGFFLQIHRSIVDPSLYGELAAMPRRRKVLHVVQLLLIASIAAAMAHTWYLLDAKQGIAAPIERAFSGLEVTGGVLTSHRPLPFAVDPHDVSILFNRLFDVPLSLAPNATPPVVVDTAYAAHQGDEFPRVVLGARGFTIFNSAASRIVLSWADAFPGIGAIAPTASFVNDYLHRRIPFLLVYFFILEGIQCGFLMFFSIGILAIAPFIFRIDRSLSYFHFLSIAGFAVTPIPVGFMLMAVSGTSIPAGGDLLFLASAVVMFRALRGMRSVTQPRNPGDRRNDL
jgi:hypothetical protein